MITKTTPRPILSLLAISTAICICLILNGKITPSGKYEFMANLGLRAYQNLTDKNIKWVKKTDIIGVRFQSENGAKELFVGFQKGPHLAPEKGNRPRYCSGKPSSGFPQNSRANYKTTIGDFDIRMKLFSYSQKATDRLSNNDESDESITNLNYVYQKCSKDKIVLLDQDASKDPSMNDMEEVKLISRFGVLIQISDR